MAVLPSVSYTPHSVTTFTPSISPNYHAPHAPPCFQLTDRAAILLLSIPPGTHDKPTDLPITNRGGNGGNGRTKTKTNERTNERTNKRKRKRKRTNERQRSTALSVVLSVLRNSEYCSRAYTCNIEFSTQCAWYHRILN